MKSMGVRFNSVKSKFILIVFIGLIFVIAFTSYIFNSVVFKYIDKIENKDLDNNFQVIDSIVNREEWNMKKTCIDWAHWDDTYRFMEGNNQEAYMKDNLQVSALKEASLNFVFFTDKQGNIVCSNTNVLENNTKDVLEKKVLNKSSKFSRFHH